jgi:hypothetical protein
MSAGTSFHGRRKPNGSAFHRRDHSRGPGRREARDQRNVAIEVCYERRAILLVIGIRLVVAPVLQVG